MNALRDHQYHCTLTQEVKEEVVDCGFVEVDSEDVHQLCTACLCATRSTHMLNDGTLKKYYMHILTETQLETGEPVLQSPRLCWVCVAHLKSLVCFREQVQDSYRLLQPMLLMCDKEDLFEFLQTSVCRTGRLKSCFAHSINISPRDHDSQMMTAYKQDVDDDGAEQLLELVKEERDLEKGVAATGSLENNTERVSSTFQETAATIGEKKFDCEKNIVVSEVLVESDTVEKPFQCKVCHKPFQYRQSLISHVKSVHAVEKPFQCGVCQKIFSSKWNLISHLRSHTGEKPFQCEVCHKQFSYKSDLIRHIRSHTGEKSFLCKVCSKQFSKKSRLMSHRTSHKGEKPFQCEGCSKSYSQLRGLISHRRSHTGEKPFQCEGCSKTFSKPSYLMKHKKIHLRNSSM